MRYLVSVSTCLAVLGLAGCNARPPAPPVELTVPVTPTTVRVTPPGGGCASDIARFRALQDSDLKAGLVDENVYKQIQGELAEADKACAQGDSLRAGGLLRATKARHGYPTG